MKYIIKSMEKPDFRKASVAKIDVYKWGDGYCPRAEARLIYVKKTGFVLRMKAYESEPKAVYGSYNDPVYKDSCLEFFASFDKNSPKYMNFEMNSRGAFLAAVRTERKNKTPVDRLASELPRVRPMKGDGWWGVEVTFTPDFIEKTFGVRDFRRGSVIRGNFYKCGDETPRPHFGMFSPVESETPDFHRPEFFAEMVIE